jgi:DNA-binding response OmpR family regulator
MEEIPANITDGAQDPNLAQPVKKGTILIVEDQRGFRRIYRDVLVDDGYEVMEATNGEEGWEMIMAHTPNLVLLDLGIPVLDGFQVLEKIRRSSQTKDIPVIIFSVLGEPKDVKKALEMGANDYTVKGFYTPRQILSKIKALISHSGSSRNINSYRIQITENAPGAVKLQEDLGLTNGYKCPDCGAPLETEFFPDYARADGHWFATRFLCTQCEKPF